MRRRVIWYMATNISEVSSASIFSVERDTTVCRHIRRHLNNHWEPQSLLYLLGCCLWKIQTQYE